MCSNRSEPDIIRKPIQKGLSCYLSDIFGLFNLYRGKLNGFIKNKHNNDVDNILETRKIN